EKHCNVWFVHRTSEGSESAPGKTRSEHDACFTSSGFSEGDCAMRPLSRAAWLSAFLLLGSSAVPARAAWCNVFQVTCFPRLQRASTSVSYYAPAPCCDPCPQVCTTRYVQRCYYQPVVGYQTRSYYEPVTSYLTSSSYEPVTSYRYSCYYDPCSCSYQQVAQPTTSYLLRSQSCAVQSWVQRCATVPVTTY